MHECKKVSIILNQKYLVESARRRVHLKVRTHVLLVGIFFTHTIDFSKLNKILHKYVIWDAP